MADEESPPEEDNPADGLWIVITQVVHFKDGRFAVMAHDLLGNELGKAPNVAGAEDWCDAMIRFWAEARDLVKKHNSAPFN
jgi:hypothetical protein